MDSPSKNMYDTFKDDIWKELGPLDPNWFDILSAQASAEEGILSDQEDLCANQEGHFKPPIQKPAAESQLFSTPKVFRNTRIVSPQTEDEKSFNAGQDKGLSPWTATQSPRFFADSEQSVPEVKYGGMQSRFQDSFDILHTPHKSPLSYAKHISESLGAQINPDISWTSSFNTPPVVPSTLILSKNVESPCPASISTEKNAVFVRKLFPSLSNALPAPAPKNQEIPAHHQGEVSPESESHFTSQRSLHQSDDVWQQKMPDATEDGEVRSTGSSVLDGAENVLSVSFANSSSALRKVKPGRNKRKQICQTPEQSCSNPASSQGESANQKTGKSPSSPQVKATDGMSQWSPLSLSEIPLCTAENNTPTKQLQSASGAGRLDGPPAVIPNSGFKKKKRQFIYTVGALKTPIQSKEPQSQKLDSTTRITVSGQDTRVEQTGKTTPETSSCRAEKTVQKQENVLETFNSSEEGKVQDLEMSQLCKEFAQDLNQISGSDQTRKEGEDSQSHFSVSACLLAMRQSKQKARHENRYHRLDDASNTKPISITNQNCSVNERPTGDSGFQSAVADSTDMTASSFVIPCSHNVVQNQQCVESDGHRTATFPTSNKGNVCSNVEDGTKLTSRLQSQLNEVQTMDLDEESERKSDRTLIQQSSSTRGTSDDNNFRLPESATVSPPSLHTFGFKTASNKGIHISSANMEKAKSLFEETEFGTISSGKDRRYDTTQKRQSKTNGSAKSTNSYLNESPSLERCGDIGCQLTASQKADVTELCTLLEEAESQFEFTQFKPAKVKQHCQDDAVSLPKADKELDPDFLSGIDFDDSFTSDVERQQAVTGAPNKMTSGSDQANCEKSDLTRRVHGMANARIKGISTVGDVPSSSAHMSEGNSSSLVTTEPKGFHRGEKTRKLETENPSMLGVAFKTAGGNVVKVSKAGLSKARSLFLDVEKEKREIDAEINPNCSRDSNLRLESSFKVDCEVTERVENVKTVTTTCQTGFHMASGKAISISANSIEKADIFFNDCDLLEDNQSKSVTQKKNIKPVTKLNISKEEVNTDFASVNPGLVLHHQKSPDHNDTSLNAAGFDSSLAAKNAVPFLGNPFSTSKTFSPPSCTDSKNIDIPTFDGLSSSDGFFTGSGKKVTVSTEAMKRAECLLNEHNLQEDKNKQWNQKESTTGQIPAPIQLPKTGRFHTSSGKRGVIISSAALKKAKSLMSEFSKDKLSVKPAESQSEVHVPLPRTGGFMAASGKPVTFSSEALRKAKAVLSDISCSVDIPGSDTKSSDKFQDDGENAKNVQFKEAGGEKAGVSQTILLKTKCLLKGSGHSLPTKAIQEADGDTEVDKKSHIMHETTESMNGSNSGKKSLSHLKPDDRETTRNSVEPEIGSIANIDKQLNQFPAPTSGFQTASGKGVIVSTEALKKAKTLLDESEGTEEKISTTLQHFKVPVSVAQSRNRGFKAASGRQVAVSLEALQKANALFNDINKDVPAVSIIRNCNKKEDNFENADEIHRSFIPAGGNKVLVSQRNPIKEKDCNDLGNSTEVIPKTDGSIKVSDKDGSIRTPVLLRKKGASINGSGDQKKSVSIPNLNETVIPSTSKDPRNESFQDSEQLKHQENAFHPQISGFKTASGNELVVSSEALQKSRTLFSECEGTEEEIGKTAPHFKVPGLNEPSRNSGFLAASGKRVAVSSEALLKAKALFSDISTSTAVLNTEKSHNVENVEKTHFGFVTARGDKVHVSKKSLSKAKHLLNQSDDSVLTEAMLESDGFMKDFDANKKPVMQEKNRASINGNSGQEKNLSDHKLNERKAINISEELVNGCTAGTHQQLQKANPPIQQNAGFQTASGKGVTISSEAIQKAKSLLKECEGGEETSCAAPPCFKVPVLPPRNSGFLAANGKQVGVSSEALQKAKALFSDISSTCSDVSVTKTFNEHETHKEGIRCGFTTAGGAKVNVSEESLLKASNLLKECAGVEGHGSHPLSTNQFDRSEPSEENLVKRSIKCNPTSNRMNMPTNTRAASGVQSFTAMPKNDHGSKDLDSSSVHGFSFPKDEPSMETFEFQGNKTRPTNAACRLEKSGKEKLQLTNSEVSRTSYNKESKAVTTEESSLVNFQSLNLTGCTETQQQFLAQEALDCTKALLEDEGLEGQSLSASFKHTPLRDKAKSGNSSAEDDDKGKRKRSIRNEDEPPLKRRLLEEFDRTDTDTLPRPMKSSPIGLLNDRAVFKYSASLHPTITRPHKDGKTFMEIKFQNTPTTQSSILRDSKSSNSKTPTFVPPFIKKAESCRAALPKEKTLTTSGFVPPFKKQRTTIKESPSEPQEADKQQHVFVKPSKSCTYVPPAKKTQGEAEVAAIVEGNLATVDDENNPVSCESACPGAETSSEEDSKSKDKHLSVENIELARNMQDMRIRKKKRQTIRPQPGSLFLTKTSGVARIPLKVAVNGNLPAKYTPMQLYGYGVQKQVSEVRSETAECFRFRLLQFVKQEALEERGGIQLGDGGWLIPSNDVTAGKEEFYRALCDTPGVDPKLISEAWVYNHYRWIVWKQASMEKSFPETTGSVCLTPEKVLLQLKYRYDVEVDQSRRPALRKITEKDDTAAKTLVLCVCEIVSEGFSSNRSSHNINKTPQGADAKPENTPAVVWLTDGWYAIKAQLDEPLTAMLHKGRLFIGGKLMIHGAQLVGSQDACPPLEAPESLMLKICANSSRPVRWDVKLGFYKDPRPFLLPVSSLYGNGGPVGCVDIIILRSYPMQWMERKSDGGVVFRSVRAEEKEARRYNSQKQKAMELLYAKIQADFEKEDKGKKKPKRRRQTLSHQDISRLQDGQELYEAVGDDPSYFQAHLSEQQLEMLHSYRQTLMDKQQAELQDRYRRALEAEDNETSCPKRDVTPVWRLCVTDSRQQPGSVYQLNLWRPSSDLQSLLKEGCRYKVYMLTTSEGKKRSGIESVQLTGTKKTQFQELQVSPDCLSARFQPRISTSFVNLQNPEYQPLCGEVDLTGFVISIIDGTGSSPSFFLADGKLNVLKVRCFSSLAQSGLEDVIKPKTLLALSNLQLRGQSLYPTPVVYAGDLTAFSTNPKEAHLQESLSKLKHVVQNQENFFAEAEERLSHLLKPDGPSSFPSPGFQPQTRTETRQDTKTVVAAHKPARSLGSFTPVGKNPPKATTSSERDPKSLKRKRALEYLSRMQPAAPLSHLSLMASPCVNTTFNPPRRSGTPSTLKTVHTPKPNRSLREEEWVNDEELAMIDTQMLHVE